MYGEVRIWGSVRQDYQQGYSVILIDVPILGPDMVPLYTFAKVDKSCLSNPSM